MWPDGFWPDNFWPTDFWIEGATPSVGGNLVLIDGTIGFDITVDEPDYTPQRAICKGRFTSPVQDSYGGLIRLAHNFPYELGDSAVVGYETPDGEFGDIVTASFDADYARAVIPEGLLDVEGRYWKFNLRVEGARNGIPFSIRSKILKVKVLDGLVDETNN